MTANFIFHGITNNFFESAFANADVASFSSTQLNVVDATSGYVTTFTGAGFAVNADGDPIGGVVNGLTIRTANQEDIVTINNINWSLVQLSQAVGQITSSDDDDAGGLFEALLSLQPVNVDASKSNIGVDVLFDGVTSPVTMLGSNFRDILGGGNNNDTINPGNTDEFDGNVVYGSLGSDTIDLGNMGPNRWFDLTYEELVTPITINLDGTAGTITVNKSAGGTDTVLNAQNPLEWGVGILGSRGNDTFNANAKPGAFAAVNGMAGNDTLNLTLSENSTLRAVYSGGWQDRPFMGIQANLETGVVANDGYGNVDQINILGGTGRFEFLASDNDDNITGSDRDEGFILRAGNDTLDAGGGYDTLKYDRSGVESVNIDLSTGLAFGTWYDSPFTHQVSNVEEVRGSREGNDTLSGDDGDNRLRAYEGNDLLQGFGGTDRLYGGDGDDILEPGDNQDFDYVDPGAGNDEVLASTVFEGFLDIGHYDLRNSTALTVDYVMDTDPSVLSDATVDKGINGTTVVLGASQAFQADGVFFGGSNLNDTFNATLSTFGWIGFKGGRGDDTYNLQSIADGDDATVRLNYNSSIDSRDRPDSGININLATGVISNDGFGGQDTITGDFEGTIEVRGTDNADIMIGSARDDRFIGRGGNDTIDGGDGTDAVRYDRSGMDSGVRVDFGTGQATGSFEGVAFTHTLSSIEQVRGTSGFGDTLLGSASRGEGFDGRGGDDVIFADGAVAAYYGAEVANQVYRLYQATLDRVPDVVGHANWSERIATGERTLLEVADGFTGSPEFQNIYRGADDAQFVTLLYNNVLGQDPDAQGLARWTGDLANGSSRAEVVLGFSESPQFKSETTTAATTFANQSTSSAWSDDVFRLYQATLDRAPDVVGQTNWSGRLATGERTLEEVAEGFVGSPEFQATYAGASDEEFVTLLYRNVLDTTPDAQGLARWTGDLANGASRAEVVLGFSQSPQFTSETADDLLAWMDDLDEHDTIYTGSGTNTVAGGQFADLFIFDADYDGTTTVLDLEAWDYLDFLGFGYPPKGQVAGSNPAGVAKTA